MQDVYRNKVLPLEKAHLFHQFHADELNDVHFASKPTVLLLGQYGVGKTTFVSHLLERDYPEADIGPEPTTDKFVVVCHGEYDQVIPGHTFVADPSMPFEQLGRHDDIGSNFLDRFSGAKCNSKVLEGLTFIDTPGILSGEQHRLRRSYDFQSVVEWFAERVDMIILMFDMSKLDISDEFKQLIEILSAKNAEKIHIVLNKADGLTTPQLMRVHGALMWYLGRIIATPEVAKVYMGSFWDEELSKREAGSFFFNDKLHEHFQAEEGKLYARLARMPRDAAQSKLNELIKRARRVRAHAFILDHLKKGTPSRWRWGGDQKKDELIENLPEIWRELAHKNRLPSGDLSDEDIRRMQEELKKGPDFGTFKEVDMRLMDGLDTMLTQDVQEINELLSVEHRIAKEALESLQTRPCSYEEKERVAKRRRSEIYDGASGAAGGEDQGKPTNV